MLENAESSSSIYEGLKKLLIEIGEDPSRNGLLDTPKRFEKQLRECMSGYGKNPDDHIVLFDDNNSHGSLVSVLSISFSSLCEHHVLPFYGYVDIAYVPSNKILGLSKFARIVDVFSKRLQVQERLTHEIADFLAAKLEPELLMVRVSATHSCMGIRGVNRHQSKTETFAICGSNTQPHQHHISYFMHNRGEA